MDAAARRTIDSSRPFTYVFEDPSWISKILIGGLLSLTIVMIPSMMGYLIDTARRVRDGADIPLPDWGEDFGGRWIRGFSLSVIAFIWSAVVFIPILCLIALFTVVAAAGSGGNSDAAGGIAGLGFTGALCLIIPLSLILSLVFPAIMVHYVNRGSFAAGFEVGAIWRIMSRDWPSYLLVFVLYFVASFIASLGSYVCIGMIFTLPYGYLIMAHLIGQLARHEAGGATLLTDPI